MGSRIRMPLLLLVLLGTASALSMVNQSCTNPKLTGCSGVCYMSTMSTADFQECMVGDPPDHMASPVMAAVATHPVFVKEDCKTLGFHPLTKIMIGKWPWGQIIFIPGGSEPDPCYGGAGKDRQGNYNSHIYFYTTSQDQFWNNMSKAGFWAPRDCKAWEEKYPQCIGPQKIDASPRSKDWPTMHWSAMHGSKDLTGECKENAIVGRCLLTGCFMNHGTASCHGTKCTCDPGSCSIDGSKCKPTPNADGLSEQAPMVTYS